MPKVVVLPVSLFLKNDQSKSEREFLKLGISRFSLFWHYIPLPGFLGRFRGPSLPELFKAYRIGDLSTNQFINQIKLKFPNANINKKTFRTAWNAMQVVTGLTHDAVKNANTLKDKGVDVYWLSGTNPLHVADLKTKKIVFPGKTYFSYREKKLEKDLLEALISNIRKQHPRIKNSEIVMFYNKPQNPHPYLGIFAWFFDPVRTYQYKQAQRYVAQLERTARELGFKLVEKVSKSQKKSGILEAIKTLGWFKKPDNKKAPIIYLHNKKNSESKSKRATANPQEKQKPSHSSLAKRRI